MPLDPDQLYRCACGAALRDGRVSDAERILLDRLRGELGLSEKEAVAIEGHMSEALEPDPATGELDTNDFVRGLVRSARSLGPSPTPEERAQLVAIGKLLQVPEARVVEWLDTPLEFLRTVRSSPPPGRPLGEAWPDLVRYFGALVTGYGGAALLLAAFFLPAAQGYDDLVDFRIVAFFFALAGLGIPATCPDELVEFSRTRALLRGLLAGSIVAAAVSMVLALGKICWELLRVDPLVAGLLLAVASPFVWKLLGRPAWAATLYARNPATAPVLARALAPFESDED